MNSVEKLLAEIKCKRKRILVLGDIMLDRYVVGHLAECQDNCAKFVQKEIHEKHGGAANAHQCLQHWEVMTDLYGQSKGDRCIKTRYLNEEGTIIFRHDDDMLLTEEICRNSYYRWSYNAALEMVECAAGVLLSDYDKGYLQSSFIRRVIELCEDRGIPCVADVKREPELYTGAILKGNATWGTQHRLEAINQGVYIETRGEHSPLIWVDCKHSVLCDKMRAVTCINHIGAGDCFAVTLTLALAYGLSLRESVMIAHSAGRVYVQHPWNRSPMPDEVAADMQVYDNV